MWMAATKRTVTEVRYYCICVSTNERMAVKMLCRIFTSSEPSAQSYSPLHFKDAEMHPPLAHIYSLDEQVGEAEYKVEI